MSSDSSEEENLELLREAANNEFFNNDIYKPKKSKALEQPRTRASLRCQDEERIDDVHVTPEFQRYAATQLMKFIDSQITEVDLPSSHLSDNVIKGGIRLFGDSTNLVSSDNVDLTLSVSGKRKKKKYTREEKRRMKKEEEERCKETAVSAEWILSQQAILGWEPCTKGKVAIYSAKEMEICGVNNKKEVEKRRKKEEKAEEKVEVSAEEKAEKKKLKRKKSREKLKLIKSIEKNEVGRISKEERCAE